MDRSMERREQFLSIMRDADEQAQPMGQKGLTTPATATDVAEQPKSR